MEWSKRAPFSSITRSISSIRRMTDGRSNAVRNVL
jgi:hypothetical protein